MGGLTVLHGTESETPCCRPAHVNTHFIKMVGESAFETVVHYTIFVLDVYSRVTSEN